MDRQALETARLAFVRRHYSPEVYALAVELLELEHETGAHLADTPPRPAPARGRGAGNNTTVPFRCRPLA